MRWSTPLRTAPGWRSCHASVDRSAGGPIRLALGVVPPDRVGDLPVISWITRPNTAPRSSSSYRAVVCQVLLGQLVREQRRHPSLGDHHGDRSDAPNSEHPDYWIRRIEFERGNCPHRRPAGGRPRPTAFSTRLFKSGKRRVALRKPGNTPEATQMIMALIGRFQRLRRASGVQRHRRSRSASRPSEWGACGRTPEGDARYGKVLVPFAVA